MRTNQCHRSLQQGSCQFMGATNRCPGSAEYEHGFNQFGSAVNCGADVEQDFVALRLRERRRGKKLRVCVDAGEVMTEIVRDRTGHAPYRRETFSLEQCIVRLQNLIAHSGKCLAKFADLSRAV